MGDEMRFATALSLESDAVTAVERLIRQIEERMGPAPIDLALVFLSASHAQQAAHIAQQLRAAFTPRVLLGCTAEGVIGSQHEIEHETAITVLAAHLPGVQLAPFYLDPNEWQVTLSGVAPFTQAIAAPADTKLFLLLADPFSTPAPLVLDFFNLAYDGVPVAGGMASGTQRPGGNSLLFDGQALNIGAVGVALSGALDVDVIVSQGCRPVGQPFAVTAAHDNQVVELDGEAALARVRSVFDQLPAQDRQLMRNGLFIGRAIDADREILGRGDFLVRGIVGAEPDSGAIVVGDRIEAGETVQLHVRDAETAAEDLELLLTPQTLYDPPSGVLLFTCNGRGSRLYGHPDGDISILQGALGGVEAAGFFCAGEIGPIGGNNFLHGHTASVVLIRPARSDD